MVKRSPRKFEAFVMHAHHDTAATYSDLFDKLSRLRAEDRLYKFSDEVVLGFPIASKESGGYFIQSVLGSSESALVLNTETGSTRENTLAKSEMLSHPTHLSVSPQKRRAAIEYSHRGPKALNRHGFAGGSNS
ncbi:hypothetical protein NLM33_14120 [Bradyrhizobium sp. CCGUVB1N3]|uniref:hypothetical protein n=1 Tax=Bradyrhizobium sp. CCGUVB1N3 TaxID=2949629 RepID=UPI0020B3776B|nr:hypothetical protein [Bradyrhizobium sp. CCGUVB1N3]MCP3471466.1 hypothetical protein [Bradyrhizobium sp. CCGUVB1N3]